MKSGGNDSKRIERRARILMMEKDIPPAKMEIVRSLMKNSSILPEEKYGAVIDLIQNCPDKKVPAETQGRKIDTGKTREKSAGKPAVSTRPPSVPVQPQFAPEKSSVFINLLAAKYRENGLFRKKILMRFPGFPGIRFVKRLVPSKNLYKAVKLVTDNQQKIASRMPFIMDAILNDSEIEDPTVYNILRILNIWMNEIPLLAIRYENAMHMKNSEFLNEFSTYIKYFISFMDMNSDQKDKVISLVELKLRLVTSGVEKIEDYSVMNAKDNGINEKIISDYMNVLKSFLSLKPENEDLFEKQLQKKFKIKNLQHLFNAVCEALVFRRECGFEEIRRYFKVQPQSVSHEKWMCSENDLKLAGKDEESRLRKFREKLAAEVDPLDEIFHFVQMKISGMSLLKKSFDDQWKILNKRRQDYGDIYNENFFGFIDECLAFFTSAIMPFMDGSVINMNCENGKAVAASIFSKEYFGRDLSRLDDLLNDIASYRTDNPTMKITRDEMKKIISGRLSTFNEIRQLMLRTGALFYNFAEELHLLQRIHRKWEQKGVFDDTAGFETLSRNDVYNDAETGITDFSPKPRPFPFYSCRIGKDSVVLPYMRVFSGKNIISDSVADSIFPFAAGFCYQIAFECSEERLYNNLVRRKELRSRLNELNGS